MRAVRIVSGRAVPLDRSDVDTDQIIPSDWLKQVERTGFEKGLFSEWRDDRNFVLNDERFAGANILIAGPNFGTGSSREHAVWAIQQAGFKAGFATDRAPRDHLLNLYRLRRVVVFPSSTAWNVWWKVQNWYPALQDMKR